jgi:hypothetical protein
MSGGHDTEAAHHDHQTVLLVERIAADLDCSSLHSRAGENSTSLPTALESFVDLIKAGHLPSSTISRRLAEDQD